MNIHAGTTIGELAAYVSQTLDAAGIKATLSGGAAVSIYTENEYESNDLDFVTAARREAPLQFGNRTVDHDEIPMLETPWGPLRVITPTQCVMDRLAAYWHWQDRQSWDQAVMVARHREVDYRALEAYARGEGASPGDIPKLRSQASAGL